MMGNFFTYVQMCKPVAGLVTFNLEKIRELECCCFFGKKSASLFTRSRFCASRDMRGEGSVVRAIRNHGL